MSVRTIDNTGDRDSILFGNLFLDDRDRVEGWGGISAARKEEEMTPAQMSYENFLKLRKAEFSAEAAEDDLKQAQLIFASLKDEESVSRRICADLKKEGLIYSGDYKYHKSKLNNLKSRVDSIKDWIESCNERLSSANSTIKWATTDFVDEADDIVYDNSKYNTIHWNAVWQYGDEQVDVFRREADKYSYNYLKNMLVHFQKKKDRKELTFSHLIILKGIIYKQLTLNSWTKKQKDYYASQVRKMKEVWKKFDLSARKTNYEPEDKECLYDPEAQVFSSRTIDIESAIDQMSVVRELVRRHNLTTEEAFEMLFDKE